MKRIIASVLAASALAGVAVPAFAAPGVNINRQQANVEHRIDVGQRNGSLTRGEASRLRAEVRQIAFLENRYRRDGLNTWERRDLERRLDVISAKIRIERHDRDTRRADNRHYR